MVEGLVAGLHYPAATGGVPGLVLLRRGLPELPRVAALADRVRLPGVQSGRLAAR
jgi:hypothetical protein